MPTLTITMPLPPRELSPNARAHWRVKAKAISHYRNLASAHTRQLKPKDWKQARSATLRVRFFFPDARRRDHDNLQASLKSAIDGIVGSTWKHPDGRRITENNGVLVDDDRLTWLPIEIDIDPFDPHVRIEIITQESP